MKYQGKVINWNDDKGFGFVEQNGGGPRAFVHINAFNPRSRRPVDGEMITYELKREKNNRYKATNIKFVQDNRKHIRNSAPNTKKSNQSKNNTLSSIFTVLFCIGLILSVLNGKVPVFVGIVYLAINLVTILVYAKDKYSAKNNRWRTPEATLHLLSLIGGWPGALFSQRVLRHKISKNEFVRVYWVTAFFNLSGLLVMYTEQGQYLLYDILLPLLNG